MTTRVLRPHLLSLPVEGMNKRSIMRDVSKLGNSWQARGQACGTARKSGMGERERWKDFPSRESEKRQLVPLWTQWRLFQPLSESLNFSGCLRSQVLPVFASVGEGIPSSHAAMLKSIPALPTLSALP